MLMVENTYGGAKGQVEVGDDVVDILQSDWQPDQVVSDAHPLPFLDRKGSMAQYRPETVSNEFGFLVGDDYTSEMMEIDKKNVSW